MAKTSPGDLAQGQVLYEATCSRCPGLDGAGSDGPSLQGVADRLSDQGIGDIIRGDGKQYAFVTAATTYFAFTLP